MRINKYIEVDVDIDIDDVLDQMSDEELEIVTHNVDTDTLIDALQRKELYYEQIKNLVKIAGINCFDIVREEFERSNQGALKVLQDMLCMSHMATKEQVIEQLKKILQ